MYHKTRVLCCTVDQQSDAQIAKTQKLRCVESPVCRSAFLFFCYWEWRLPSIGSELVTPNLRRYRLRQDYNYCLMTSKTLARKRSKSVPSLSVVEDQ